MHRWSCVWASYIPPHLLLKEKESKCDCWNKLSNHLPSKKIDRTAANPSQATYCCYTELAGILNSLSGPTYLDEKLNAAFDIRSYSISSVDLYGIVSEQYLGAIGTTPVWHPQDDDTIVAFDSAAAHSKPCTIGIWVGSFTIVGTCILKPKSWSMSTPFCYLSLSYCHSLRRWFDYFAFSPKWITDIVWYHSTVRTCI